jgi:D-tyrosyl-tRNA(Tyr) deacylase
MKAMRAVIQRVARASVTVDQQIVGRIGRGLLVLLGIEPADTGEDIGWLTGKIARLRIFADEQGAMNRSVREAGGDLLVVSQLTLFASVRKGNRPSFMNAAPLEQANRFYEEFCEQLELEIAKKVQRGIFGADMQVELLNEGPVTIWIDTKNRE